MGLEIDRIVTATGSAGTHAGLVAGIAVIGADIPILGIGVRAPKETQEANVFKLAQDTAELLGHRDRVTREMVVADCSYVGEGYGLVDQGGDRRPGAGRADRRDPAGPGLYRQGR
jgi:L-cysteate sulfo-lyase